MCGGDGSDTPVRFATKGLLLVVCGGNSLNSITMNVSRLTGAKSARAHQHQITRLTFGQLSLGLELLYSSQARPSAGVGPMVPRFLDRE